MKNKKSHGIIVLVAIIIFTLSNCVVTPTYQYWEGKITDIFDKSVPAEQSALLTILGGNFKVNSFSGQKVKWWGLTDISVNVIQIPSGEHAIEFDFIYGGTIHEDKKLDGNFKAGHVYGLETVYSNVRSTNGRYQATANYYIIDRTPGVTERFLIINGLDEFNGKYIAFSAKSKESQFSAVIGANKLQDNNHIGVQIIDGIAEIPVFTFVAGEYKNFNPYNSCENIKIFISDNEVFAKTTLNGNGQYILSEISFTDSKAVINFSDLKGN